MPRRKPASGKQRKEQLQIKRAIKRGDASLESATASNARTTRQSGNRSRGGRLPRDIPPVRANVDASRRLESSFVKFSPEFLQDAKRKASSLIIERPIPPDRLLYQDKYPGDQAVKLAAPRRPKWRYDMSKKEVESNEAAQFKRWLDETDQIIQAWKDEATAQTSSQNSHHAEASGTLLCDSQPSLDASERMVYASPLFERNLEVWRQLWRVVEICEVLLVLLDARCPPLHYPPSLESYLSSFRPPRRVIFVLTKTDITGPRISSLWKEYLLKSYPTSHVVIVESYVKKPSGEGRGNRIIREPHIPRELRRDLVHALKEVHRELCSPPPHIASDASKLANWKPSIVADINWDALVDASDTDISYFRPLSPTGTEDENRIDNEDGSIQEYLSVGLIGQPNVGKSSLLNALFGRHKVKASKTPGKTKHFQTLFWSKQIRLVDCPGLVFPSFVDLELQVLAGVLPISQIPAIPSSIYYALQYIPLEDIFELPHPAEKDAPPKDKRTWRAGMQPKSDSPHKLWTSMDVLTAFAEKKGWITAKAGRPDVNRAGNYILRLLAEGRIRWAFCPPDTNLRAIVGGYTDKGILIEEDSDGQIAEYDDFGDNSDGSQSDSGDENNLALESDEEYVSTDSEAEPGITVGRGMFSALTLEDHDGSQ